MSLASVAASVFAAQSIGQPAMNLLQLEPAPRGAAIAGSRGMLAVPHATPGMVIGIRAEDIRLGERDRVTATVLAKEYLGADTMLRCQLGSGQLLVRAGRAVPAQVGDSLRLSWRDDALHLFDGRSGHRVDTTAMSLASESIA